ncbi:DUF5123 domain-containing protein [Pontibacter diazotrophicus]|uniref:DUF5123 domain-containing protein n=1 Tax=Pontibacter diazotrophicus TaxID=1400979 RepID=A0A3D8LD38_9BACT|nr:DUF5123 domain-containing protein [Pontibacter diazotrophicus]RDV15317.1 DUF5123 domain-containing protein [Pontibacter diazotrophicus]
MKKFLNKISNRLIPMMLLMVLAVACKEELDELEPMRMFTPTAGFRALSSETQVKLTWNRSLYTTATDGVTYTVEVAEDTLFQTPVILSVQTDTAGVVFTDEQLQVRQDYFARVKANALGDRPESNWVVSNSFRISGEQIFAPLQDADVIDVAVVLRWREEPGLTRIVLTPEVGEPIEVALTEADIAERRMRVEGLTPTTVYTAEIFQGTQSKGITTFTTKETLVGDAVIDLTGITDRPSVLMDTLSQIESGSTVVLKRGMTYEISSTTNLDRSVTIVSENTLDPQLATIYFTSNFNIEEGSEIDSLVFRNVVMRSSDYGGKYVFNINKASDIGMLKFDAVHAEIFRGIVRLQSAGINIDEFAVVNSVIDSVANYGVLTIDNAGANVNHILFSNSTFYKIERVMTSKAGSQSIVIENTTFSEAPEGGRYLIDYNSNDVADGIIVRNTLIGRGKNSGGSREVRGIRAGSGTLIESSSTYATSDYVATSNEIPGLSSYSGTSFDLFTDPENGNFTIKDTNFDGASNTGDPRWRP